MGILYILTLIILGISFMIFKKTDEKINFIKWLIIYIVSLLGYNILIGMILGLLNITSHIWLLSIINLIFSGILGYKAVKNKEFQKYYVRKIDIVGIIIILAIFSVMFVKDLYIYNGNISHMAVDSAIHYRAAKHYADNLKIFINLEDKTFFNFNIMQTGAYINDGIFMNVIHGITKIDYSYLYQAFETIVLFLGGLAFYATFIEKINTKRGLVGSLILFTLYLYGYPYNAWIYGFSYLAVGIAMAVLLLAVTESLYSEKNLNKVVGISLIVIASFGLIFSYCLFVPAIFASICIYCFLKDLSNKESKKYLKIFGKNTLIITGLLLIVTAVGIGYLFIPSFFIEGQTDLVNALKIDGGIYSEKYRNFLAYIPFAVIYCVEIIKKIKNKQLTYMDIFSVIMVGYLALLLIGYLTGFVAKYYMLKVYSIIWVVVFSIVIDILNKYIDWKVFRIDMILLIALYFIMYFKGISEDLVAKVYLLVILCVYMVLPEILRKFETKENQNKIINKLKKVRPVITGFTYVLIWGIFVCSWVWIKAGHIIGEEEKHALPNLVGIYYIENCEYRKLIDLNNSFNSNEIKLVKYARENFDDMNVENTELMTEGYYTRIWATAMLEISSDKVPYQNVVQDTTIYKLDDALKDENKKYIVKLVSEDLTKIDEYNEELKEVKSSENIKIIYENENGYVAVIDR